MTRERKHEVWLYRKDYLKEPARFLELYKKYEGNATAAVMELRPDLGKGTCSVLAVEYMSYLDPLKMFLPRNGKKLNVNDLEIEGKNHNRSAVTNRNKEELFRALYEKYGADGMKSAMLAVAEIYPQFKKRGAIVQRARNYLAQSGVISDLITALEARGVDAHKTAEKIAELLNAKKKITTYIKGDMTNEVEEVDVSALDKGLTHAIKAGVGGGYAPERSLVGIKDFSLGRALEELDKEEDREIK